MSSSDSLTVTIVGGGNMGTAVLRSLASTKANIRLATRSQATLDAYAASHNAEPFQAPDATHRACVGADIVVLALKPAAILATAAFLAKDAADGTPRLADGTVVVSLAAGLSLAALHGALPPNVVVIRGMPSTPMAIGSGTLSLAAADPAHKASADALVALTTLFEPAADAVVTVPEDAMHAVTALAGSGPAYIFAMAEAFLDAGSILGLEPQLARDLVRGTIVGAASYLASHDDFPATRLRTEVTSPNGTTAAALSVLDERNWRAILVDAIRAGAARSVEMGKALDDMAAAAAAEPSTDA
ncbi:pyrroline-5-carboxylate reductase [Thecamonas trahens ATCC 50062]|uniref:Pyrroline-5-carboxylate reductase n=1 Tax=Thecamonas trahens ATCC 50062 TaxID=461836 RepID=A0A0L0D5Y1_THETB|nr:pyrroline-5-carboxylate reductase [Thecamonas trahens ATCC 50062]KNC47491.1 pyrroline-5-carboxylate reductase [Thecamonas trahens ATCC 50062]|eukprot:XP_013759427.1 pyrroline-5-carboxylate reductase [Thecamonas trahens ATCC 50062]